MSSTTSSPAEGASITDAPSAVVRRLSLGALLVATGVLYLWNLSINGWANSFYAAAIQAGSKSWKAWFFGSSDMANSITVDKPPASLWIPGLSARIFGMNSWSMLVPNALMGVAAVALLYVITRRYFGHWAGILASGVLALVPVSAMMFRFNNPEALLILLMVAAVWATMRAVEDGRWRWMILTGVFIGFGFLTKQLQVMLIVPAVALTYFAFGPRTWAVRLGQCFAALGALIVSAGWWILAVELWPKDSRPWIGGSQNNSILELTLGYNGLGRLNGNETGSVMPGGGGRGYEMGAQVGGYAPGGQTGGFGGYLPAGMSGGGMGGPGMGGPGGGRGGMWGSTGFWRMFEPEQGGQISWLIPTGLILAVVALVLIGRARRTDPRRAYLVVWGLWLLITMAVFSYMAGIFHSYYTAALAPAVAALVAGGAAVCWRARERFWVRCWLAAAIWAAAIWGFVLLNRSPDFLPWLRWTMLIVGIASGFMFLLADRSVGRRPIASAAIITALIAGLAGPLAYTIDTVGSTKQGSIISAGPRSQGGMFGPGRGGPRGAGNGIGRGGMLEMPGMGGPGGMGGGMGMGGGYGDAGGGAGGLLMGSTPSAAVVAKLRENADQFVWVGAATGSNSASGFQLESGYSVMPIGGFNGTDPSPTLEQFKQYVAEGKIHYFIGGAAGFGGGPGGGSGTGSQIREWVTENFTEVTVDGTTLYDLTDPK